MHEKAAREYKAILQDYKFTTQDMKRHSDSLKAKALAPNRRDSTYVHMGLAVEPYVK